MYFCRKLVGIMAKNSQWQDDYWLLLMQLYLQRPTLSAETSGTKADVQSADG